MINGEFKLTRLHESPEEMSGQGRVFFIRHGQAQYESLVAKAESEDPQGSIDIERQIKGDLTEIGRDQVQQQAESFFKKFNKEKDIFFVVSSNQVRALETASLFINEAVLIGFSVLRHQKTGSDIAREIGEGYIRSLSSLSINKKDILVELLFTPPDWLPDIKWEFVDDDFKLQWERARSIILEGNQGSWGLNFHRYAEEIKKIFPVELATPKDLYKTQFQDILRLVDFAKERVGSRSVHILAFGHEDYMGIALEEGTGNSTIGNAEIVEIK